MASALHQILTALRRDGSSNSIHGVLAAGREQIKRKETHRNSADGLGTPPEANDLEGLGGALPRHFGGSRRDSGTETERKLGEVGMRRTSFWWIGILACGLFAISGATLAADVTLSGYNSFKTLAAGDGGVDPNVYEVSGNLTLDGTASINCNDNATDQPPGPVAPNASACDINISVTGNLVMNPGSAIKAENQVAGGNGGNITILVGGNVLLQGGSPAGALISSRKTAGAGDTGIAGNVTIHAGNIACEANPTKGDVTVEAGAQILADGTGDAGDIEILAGRFITIDGKVSSKTATTVGRGGVIRLIACCDLRVGESGIVSSRGSDPAADLVHLEGCTVVILGLVESTGPGHNDAAGGSNLCNDANHVAPAGHTFRACVEIWSGSTVLIDASGANNGQVNADTAQGGGSSGMGWIDIYANGNITILGNAAPPFAVHANTGVGGAIAGPITIKSKLGAVTATNLAVQASNYAAGGNGGSITMAANTFLALTTATLEAQGDYVPTIAKGGTILLQTIATGTISWLTGTGDVRPTGSGVPVANRGTITLAVCLAPALGATFPVSAGAQTNPIAAACIPAVIIPDPANTALNARFNCAANNCGREVPLPPPFCSKAPVRAVLDPVTGQFPGNQGPDVLVRVDLGQSIQDALDAANVPGFDAAHNNDGYIIIAISAHGDGSLGGHTNQGAEIAGSFEFPFALIGCSVTMHGPPVGGNAIGHITQGATAPPPLGSLQGIFIMDLHTADGTTGWLVEGNGRYVRNTGGGTSGTGVWIKGDNNVMHNGAGSGNSGVGLKIEGNGNYVTDTDVFANGSHGVQVIGNNNQILKVDAGDKGKGNGGDGVNASGTGNTFSEIDAFANTGWGFNVTGTGNNLTKNRSGDRGKANAGGFQLSGSATLLQNTAIGNGGDGFNLSSAGWNLKNNISGGTGTGYANGGCQYTFAVAGNANQGGNKSNGVTLVGTPIAAGCK